MTPREIEERLLSMFGQSIREEGAPELIITMRRHEDYEKLLFRIDELLEENRILKADTAKAINVWHDNLNLIDQLREAKRRMKRANMDVSFIRSVK